MPWPAYIIHIFEATPGGLGVDNPTEESLFYGSYNALLSYLFPPTEKYTISPQFRRLPATETSFLDFTTVFMVQKASHPVFLLEINSPSNYGFQWARAEANDQIRAHFFELVDEVDLPVIHGLSALGTRLCFYSYHRDNNTMAPPPIQPRDVTKINDLAPAEWWNIDLLSEEGVSKLTEVADAVKAMVSQTQWLVINHRDPAS